MRRVPLPGCASRGNWSPYTSPDLCGDLSEKLVWVLPHPRNYPGPSLLPPPAIVDVRLCVGIYRRGAETRSILGERGKAELFKELGMQVG